MAKIAVMGHGVVGSGVVEVLHKNKSSITRRTGQEISIKYILDLRDFPDSPYHDKFIKDFSLIENDDEISVVVEVMGGLEPAYSYVKRCLQKGKSVVTSNKELVASKGAELLRIAREHNVNFFFEASVGGGIPIIRPLHQCLAANEIKEIAGILNGTTNFILTKMIRESMSFEDALKMAQQLGYAERDPSADVNGDDACRKICILASLAFSNHIYPQNVPTEGITKITLADVEYAGNWGGVIKLLGVAKKMEDGKVLCYVSPALLSSESQLANVDDVFNAVLVRGNATGDVVFYGKGAGKLPTASAVVADVIDVIKNSGSSKSLFWNETDENFVASHDKVDTSFYLRLQADDPEDAKKQIISLFPETEFLSRKQQPQNELAFVTDVETDEILNQKIAELQGVKILSKIRVLDY